ncbi:MAG: membrane dipeptidase, partial [Planctomycetes bacterium]|nr:membrane dipeptidase [Planctomycetota bacterium]
MKAALSTYSAEVRERALRLHSASVVCDLHADTFIAVRYVGCDLGRRHKPPRFWNPLRKHCDLPRLREGGVNLQGFGVVIPPWVRGQVRFRHARGTIRLMHETFRRLAKEVGLARTPAEAAALREAG